MMHCDTICLHVTKILPSILYFLDLIEIGTDLKGDFRTIGTSPKGLIWMIGTGPILLKVAFGTR